MRRSTIPFDRVPGFRESSIFLDYLGGKEPVCSLLPPLPRKVEELRDRANRIRSIPFPREELAERLLEYNLTLGAGQATLAGIQAIRAGAPVVVTGQQPGLFGGPLYATWKAMTACLLARAMGDAVPVFWIASEDHDLAEVNRHDLWEGRGESRLSLDLEDRRSSLSEYDIDGMGGDLLDRIREVLPPTEFTDSLMEEVGSWIHGGFGGWFARQMLWMFRDWGMVVVEPRVLRDLQYGFVEREIRDPAETAWIIREAGDRLRNAGHVPLLSGDEGPGIFVDRGGVRERISFRDGDLVLRSGEVLDAGDLLGEDPSRFSAGVALRPIVQDGVLPVVASVVGPSEVGYLSQLGGAYDHHGVDRPYLVPRVSLTMVEGKVERILGRLGVGEVGIFDVHREIDVGAGEGFVDARGRVEEALGGMRDALPDPLKGAYPRSERKIVRELDRLQRKVEEEERRQVGLSEDRISRVERGILPEGKLQERFWGVLAFLNRYGPELVGEIADIVMPFEYQHDLIWLGEE